MLKGRLRRFLVVLGATALLGWGVVGLLFDFYSIPSETNLPTLSPGDRVLARPTESAERGDLVIYSVSGDDTPRVSRVVATGGDTIEGTDDGVLLNGEPLDEPYLDRGLRTPPFPEAAIPNGSVFLMSDNRPAATDSRRIGPIPTTAIMGRVVWIWAPPGRFGAP